MSSYLNDILKSGKQILTNTKQPKPESAAVPKASSLTPTGSQIETNPHKAFVKRTIQKKPKKADVVEEFKNFIASAEAQL